MKLRCPRCQQKLKVPDRLAGKGVRCPACNRPFNAPAPKSAAEALADKMDLDLEGLAQLERQSSEMNEEELKSAEDVLKEKAAAPKVDPRLRTCPTCCKQTMAHDAYAEVLCQHCWNPIPAVQHLDAGDVEIARMKTKATEGFYASLMSCVTYPLPALGSILTAAGVAFAAGLVPLAVISGLSNVMEQGAVGTAQGPAKPDLSNLSLILMGTFALEVLFFSAVALHTFLDAIRSTFVGTEKPPSLTWDPSQWGKSIVAYVVLVVYLVGMACLVLSLTVEGGVATILGRRDVSEVMHLGGRGFLVGMVVISLGVPMNFLGMALGNVVQAIDPTRLVKSIVRTHGHYLFLFLLVAMYGVFFGSAFWAIVHDWFVPRIESMLAGSKEGNMAPVAMGLLAWGAVMSFYFYGAYVMGRLHGLFARSFHKRLQFGTG